MNAKKGFTLVELLATIFILSIILLISVPRVIDLINSSRLKIIEDGTKVIAKNAEQNYLSHQAIDGSYTATAILCEEVAKVGSDYETCNTIYDSEGTAIVTLVGSDTGKFSGITCVGTKDDVNCANVKITTIHCENGEYLKSGEKSCSICPSGYECSGGTFLESTIDQGKKQCSAGYYANEGSESCSICINGYTSEAGASACSIECSNSTGVASWSASARCTGATCNAGYYKNGNACTACTAGTTTSAGNAETSCSACSNATGVNAWSSGCTISKCNAGYYKNGNACTACTAGTTTSAGNTSTSCSACSNNAHVATWTSGCTINKCATGYTLSSNTCVSANFGEYLITKKGTSGLSTSKSCGLYRYQGPNSTVTNNYVCFGTSSKATCTGNTDRYMYRIIGVDSSGNVRLIKRTPSATDYYWASYKSDCRYYWNESNLRQQLINYATGYGTTWTNMIINSTWYRTDSNSGYYTSTHMALTGTNMCNTEKGFVSYTAKAGAMMIHDYYLATGNNVSCGKDNGGGNGCSNSWINLGSNGGSNSTYEWTMAKRGTVNSYCLAIRIYKGMATDSNATITASTTSPARPVFYISSSVKYVSGSGTLSDPYIISS